jgi:superoxide dismutase, Fe-Mn family
MSYTLPDLSYPYDALEPYMDEETVRIHHTKHHQKYVDNFNEALEGTPMYDERPEDMFPRISKIPDALARNAGQAFNHTVFWRSLAPDSKKEPAGALADAINKGFGSFPDFKQQFNTMAAATFGSGWAWLIKKGGIIQITSTSNHINPLMDVAEEKGKPLFCVDVWEHAYYLKYRNKRTDYLDAIWNILNWEAIENLFTS